MPMNGVNGIDENSVVDPAVPSAHQQKLSQREDTSLIWALRPEAVEGDRHPRLISAAGMQGEVI